MWQLYDHHICGCAFNRKPRLTWTSSSGAGPPAPKWLRPAERPGALKKPVKRTETTRAGESQDEPRAALLEGVADQHRRHRKQAESCKAVHLSTHISAAFGISRRPRPRPPARCQEDAGIHDPSSQAFMAREASGFILAGSERNRRGQRRRALGRERADNQSARRCGAASRCSTARLRSCAYAHHRC
jgi:hypothetical protein